ncbi:MAG: thioredoxin family protein [Planctomycetota bacterium]|jgi:thiol-disulfide isomerase/thioredoxin
MQEQAEKKNNNSYLYALLLAFAVVIVAGAAYYFWPVIKGLPVITKAAGVFNNDVSLTGIFYTERKPAAVVNGKIVHEGDVIDGVRVLKILKHKVEFESSDRRWTQSMPAAEEGVVGSSLPVLLELGSQGCPPCRRMTPILNQLKTEYAGKFEIRYIDVWANRAAGTKYGVRKIPTQIFFDKNGKELFRHVGFYSKKDILNTWKRLGIKL